MLPCPRMPVASEALLWNTVSPKYLILHMLHQPQKTGCSSSTFEKTSSSKRPPSWSNRRRSCGERAKRWAKWSCRPRSAPRKSWQDLNIKIAWLIRGLGSVYSSIFNGGGMWSFKVGLLQKNILWLGTHPLGNSCWTNKWKVKYRKCAFTNILLHM